MSVVRLEVERTGGEKAKVRVDWTKSRGTVSLC